MHNSSAEPSARAGARIALSLALLLASPTPAGAQEATVVGRVLDPDGRPIADVVIAVDRLIERARTHASGVFQLRLPEGVWTIRARRLGRGEAVVRIDVGGDGRWRTVEATPRDTASAVAGAGGDTLRLTLASLATELRAISVRAEAIAPLAQVVTTETVRLVPALGEPDIFRAVQLLPGVSQPNDMKGSLHLAGGASDETAVFLDGHPLRQPFHLQGLLGAFNVAALERASVHIHAVPGDLAGTLGGAVALDSRVMGERPATELVASVLAASATVARPRLVGGLDALVSGRVTYLDRVLDRFAPSPEGEGISVPKYRDLLVRLGQDWGSDTRAELLAFRTDDGGRSPEAAATSGGTRTGGVEQGEHLIGIRLTRGVSHGTLRLRASVGDAWVRGGEAPAGIVDVRQTSASGAAWLVRPLFRGDLSLGASLDRRIFANRWDASADIPELFGADFPVRFDQRQVLTLAAATAQLGHAFGGWARTEVRARTERGGGRTIVLPSLLVTTEGSDRWRLSLAASRRAQWTTQAVEPLESTANPPQFVLERPRTSLMVAAVAERRHATSAGDGATSVTAFARRADEQPVLERSPTDATALAFPVFARRRASAGGMSIATRQTWHNGVAVQGSYTWQRTTLSTPAGTQPTDWDVPHAVTLYGGAPLGRGWTFSAVLQARSGAPITPVEARVLVPDALDPQLFSSRYLLGSPNSGRVDPYRRLDLSIRRGWRALGADWAANASLLNTTSHQNPLAFGWYGYFCREAGRCETLSTPRTGLPLLPSVGLEVRW